jgi:cytochrome c-type biogenesis protein CcmH
MRYLLLLWVLVSGSLAWASDPVVPAADDEVSAEDIAAAPSLSEPPLLDPPSAKAAEVLSEKISKGLRCVVCQGLSVADSNAEVARAMHTRVRELVSKGYSEEQILGYFVDRYGSWVQLEPPREGLNWVLWLGPGVLFVMGAVVIARQVNASGIQVAPSPLSAPAAPPSATTAEAPAQPSSPTSSLENGYRDRILAELGDREKR